MSARLLVGAVASAVVLATVGASPVLAENDPYGVITDADGTRWVTMSMAEFQAQPAVAHLERAMRARASRDFRAGDDSATDDDPRPRWTVVQDGKLTRFLEKRGSTRTIRYVGPARECVRKATKGTPFSIASDTTSDFTCRARRAGTSDGSEYIQGFLPSALARAELPPDPRVLVREADLVVPTGADQAMKVIIRHTSLLRTLGVYGGPGVFVDYDVTTSGMSTEFDVSNGISWALREFVLSNRGVPDLPRAVSRQVR